MKNLPKEFSFKHWRRVYDRIHKMGAELKKKRDKKTLEEGEEEYLTSEINSMTTNLNLYMDKNGMKMPHPLWRFDIKDARTWVSSDDFMYHDRSK
jgi:hypothetical protein